MGKIFLLFSDIPLSNGVKDVKTEPHKLNSVEFRWDASKPASVFVKINCISTEFTPKKHGGEKGVPFRYSINSNIRPCYYAVISLFRSEKLVTIVNYQL